MSLDDRIESLEHDTVRRVEHLVLELKSLIQKIKNGATLNTLGELQSLPGIIDCRVAALAELQALKREMEEP